MGNYSGYTAETPKKLLLDAGAFFKNFYVATDTFATAVAAGKLLGATQGGGVFSAIPTIRSIPIDGIKGIAKGMEVIDEWVVTLTANVKEIKKTTIQAALISTSIDTSTSTEYDIISTNNAIALTDYIDNITWVGTLSGNNDPVIIQVYNALSTSGLTVNTVDKAEAVIALIFIGHYDDLNLSTPPFKIYYPKEIINSATASSSTFSKAIPVDITFTIITSDLALCGGVRFGTVTLLSSQYILGTGTVLIKKEYLGTLTNGATIFTLLMDKGNNIIAPTITVGA